MVAATKKKLVKDPRTARASRKGSKKADAKVAGQSDKFATDQQALIPDADERIAELDEECQRYFSARDSLLSAREDSEKSLDKIGQMLHKYDLNLYILNGKKFFLEPGKEIVKVKKVKNNG